MNKEIVPDSQYKQVILNDTPCPIDKLNIKPDKDILEDKEQITIVDTSLTDKHIDKPWLWKPGQSGNPKGRPVKDNCLTSLVKDKLTKKHKDGRTYAEKIADALVDLAIDKGARGQIPALKEVLDRIEGKVTENIDIESRDVSIEYKLVTQSAQDTQDTQSQG